MGNETATDPSMQDIASRVEDQLFGSDDTTEQDALDTDVALDDDENLPEGDDTDVDDSEGSEDLDDIANEVEDAMMAIAKKHGVKYTRGGGKYSDVEFRIASVKFSDFSSDSNGEISNTKAEEKDFMMHGWKQLK